jgi:hypothetical protein
MKIRSATGLTEVYTNRPLSTVHNIEETRRPVTSGRQASHHVTAICLGRIFNLDDLRAKLQ